MGNFFQSATKFDPISHAFSPGGKFDILHHNPPPNTPPYAGVVPGSQLYAPPAGGPPQDPRGGGGGAAGAASPDGSGAPSTYTPNFFEQQQQQQQQQPPGVVSPPSNPFAGMQLPVGGSFGSNGIPPGMANTQPIMGNPDIQRQQIMAQMLRGGGGMSHINR